MSTRQYNYIFSKLTGQVCGATEQPQNVMGLLAYGIYKQEKMAYIEEFRRKKERDPEEHELDEFHTISVARIPQYLRDAERQLTDFVDATMQDNLEMFKHAASEGKKEALKELIIEQKKEFKKLHPSVLQKFWNCFFSGIIGNASFLILIALLAFLFHAWLADFVGTFLKTISNSR